MNKIKDPRDGRRKIKMIHSLTGLGCDCTVWEGSDGISIYASYDSPKYDYWVHGLSRKTFRDHMPRWAAHRL